MSKVFGELLLGVLSNILYDGGKTGLAKFFGKSPARKAIDATAKDFPGIASVGDALTKWCLSDEFAECVTALNQGGIPEVQESIVDSFVGVGGFFDGLTNTHASARRVLEAFSNHLEQELYRSGEGDLIEAQRAKVRHGETQAGFERISAQLDERADEINAALRDQLSDRLPAPTRTQVIRALSRMTEDNWEREATLLRELVDLPQLGTEPAQAADSYPSVGSAPLPEAAQFDASKLPGSMAPPPAGEFVGREAVLNEIAATVGTTRMILFTGIPGVGKTTLIGHVAAGLAPQTVFWYSFEPGLISVNDILLRLAQFLDGLSDSQNNLTREMLTDTLPLRSRIDHIIQELSKHDCHLFFDKVHLVNGDAEVDGFFSVLKERLREGTVYLESRSVPTFITPVDEASRAVSIIKLTGLDQDEVREFFARKNIQISPEAAHELSVGLDGLPLALELLAALADGPHIGEELMGLAHKAKESVIEYLFDEVYTRLGAAERELLTTASLLRLPYTKAELLGAHKAVSGHNASGEFTKLRRQSLIKLFGADTYHVHEVIRSLAIENADIDLNVRRHELAEHLFDEESQDLKGHLEAVLLLIHADDFDRAAEVATNMMDREFLRYNPSLAETLMKAFTEEKVSSDRWVWVLGDKGAVASFWRRYDEAESYYRRMLELAERIDEKYARAIALLRLGIIYADRDDEIAERYYLDSLAIDEELGDLKAQADVYNNLSLIYSSRGDYEQARLALEKGLELHEQLESPDWMRLGLNSNLGILYARQGKWEKALEYSGGALRIAEEMESPYDIARATYNLGRHDAEMGNLESAKEKYLRALETGEKYDLWEIRELACTALGRLYHDLKDYGHAIDYFQRVADVREEVKDYRGLSPIHFDIGTLHSLQGDGDAAVEFYERGLSIFEHLTDERLIDLYLRDVESLAHQDGRTEVARRLVKALRRLKSRLMAKGPSYTLARLYEALGGIYLDTFRREGVGLACLRREADMLGQMGRTRDQAESLIDLGAAYQNLSRYGDALGANQEALEISQTHGFSDLKGTILFNTANCYVSLEMYSRAEEHYRHALDIATELNDRRVQRLAQHNLGETLRKQGKINDAIELMRSSLSFDLEEGDFSGAVKALNNIGLAYQDSAQDDKAVESFEEAVSLARSHALHSEEANTLISLGNFYLWDDPAKAKGYYERALSAARAGGNIDMEEGAMLSLAVAHRELGTMDEISEELRSVAERANRLGHNENFIKFLALAGEVNLEEGEVEPAAEMFEKALAFAYLVAVKRWEQFRSRDEEPFYFDELFQVIRRIAESLDQKIEEGNAEIAREFYRVLLDKMRSAEYWKEDSLVIRYILPIGDYLNELPSGSVRHYIADAWSRIFGNDDSEESADQDGPDI